MTRYLGLLLGLCAGCSDEPEHGALIACIYGGGGEPSQVELSASERRSIVALYEPQLDALCSAVIIADGALLTAKHCLSAGRSAYEDVELLFGVDAYASSHVGHPTSAVVHPDVDAAVLYFDIGLASEVWPSTPIGLYGGAIDKSLVGRSVEIAGFGRAEDSQGHLRFARQRVVAVDPATITITTGMGTGACFGDSGGPLLVGTTAGPAVLGILGQGPDHCQGGDHYVRADLVRSITPSGCPP